MPWIAPAHQAPALALKAWKPKVFSGLGLALGTVAPDLAFILRLETDSIASHTFLGQIYVTVPCVLVLHAVVTRLVLPWLLPRLPTGDPLYLEELSALRPARSALDWGRVALSGFVGGLTHVLLDGITHGNESGWAVPFLPWLRTPLPAPLAHVPLYDALHAALSLVLGVGALLSWRQLARERRLWTWRGALPRPSRRVPLRDQWQFLAWIVACAVTGAFVAPLLRGSETTAKTVELAAYGALAFAAYALTLRAAAHRFGRWLKTGPGRRRALGEPASP
jgi:hypothetical protein